jgi:hypothetical protein
MCFLINMPQNIQELSHIVILLIMEEVLIV